LDGLELLQADIASAAALTTTVNANAFLFLSTFVPRY
jgi:hypothetical protein